MSSHQELASRSEGGRATRGRSRRSASADETAPQSVAPRTFLVHQRFRWLKWFGALCVLSIAGYAWDDPVGGRSGGSWVGYGFGTISAAMIVWLMWFGIRKRSYAVRGAPLRGWLSAHVYLGASLLLLVPLHSAFQFGWNVHTLAFALMVGTIVTGFLGIVAYTAVPTPMTRNRPGVKLDALLQDIADVDAECRVTVAELPDFFAREILKSIEDTRIGGGFFAQLRPRVRDCPTALAREAICDPDEDLDGQGRDRVRRLLELLALKQALLARVRTDLRYRALLDLWLLVHVPLAFGTVATVIIHVFAVFYFR
jgi:hypothetical protein